MTSHKRLARTVGFLYLLCRTQAGSPALGMVLVAASASYLVDFLAAFLSPDLGKAIHGFASILPAIAEPSMVLYLLVIGVWTRKPKEEPILAAG